MSRLIIPAMLTEAFLYVWARFSAPSRPCSSPANAVKTMVLLGLYEAKMRASSRDTATPDALIIVSPPKLKVQAIKNLLIDCTWRIASIVNGIAVPRIIMSTRNIYSVRVLATLKCRNYSRNVDWEDDALIVTRIFDEAVPVHRHSPFARIRRFLELFREPCPCSADPSVRICLARECVPGTKRCELTDGRFDVCLRNL
jgi:hypothetical protein